MREVIKKIIACPRCKGNLSLDEKKSRLRCKKCKKEFKIEEDIPWLIE